MVNKYTEEALDNILEILDGVSWAEFDEIIYAIEGARNKADEGTEEYFNYAEYLLMHKQGGKRVSDTNNIRNIF